MCERAAAKVERVSVVWRRSAIALIAAGALIFPMFACQLAGTQASPAHTGGRSPGIGPWKCQTGIRAFPAIIRTDLGRFLWFIDAKVGQVVLCNTGNTEALIRIDVRGITQDGEGNFIFIPASEEVAAALSVSHSSFRLAPGVSRTIRITIDPRYVRRRDRFGLCAALEVRSSPSGRDGAAPGLSALPGINIPVIVRLPGNHVNRLSLEDVDIGESREDGMSAIRVKVRNRGETYILPGGTLSLEPEGGVRAKTGKLGLAVTPGLVLPGCARWLEAEIPQGSLNVGHYEATLIMSVNGKTVLNERFMLKMNEDGCVSIRVP